MALLVIRLWEDAGIPSLELFSSLAGLAGLPSLILRKMLWRTFSHQKTLHLLSDLAFVHTYLFKTNSELEVMSPFCLRNTGMSWEVTVLLHSLHSRHLCESQVLWARLLGNHFLSSDIIRTCVLKYFGEPSPGMKSPCWLLWRPGDFSSLNLNLILLGGSWLVTERD